MIFGEMALAAAEGAILAHSVRRGGLAFKKGRVLAAADLEALAGAGVATVFAARLEPDDVAEDEAAATLAKAVAGPGAVVQAPFTGRCNLYAAAAGVALIEAARVADVNRLDESLTLATVPPFEPVAEGQMLATVKVIPFAVPRRVLAAAVELAAGAPAVGLAPFTGRRAGLVVTVLPETKPGVVRKTRQVIADRLRALGSELGDTIECGHAVAAVAEAIVRLTATGHWPVLVFGASAIVDRGDVVPAGLTAAGGEVSHLGMPVDPGNLLMLGRLGPTPVIGVPSCARSPKFNGFDQVLARVAAGIEVTPRDIMDMGAGGLLTEIASRPLPREGARPGPRAPRIAAVVLAAGLSRRFGGANKLTRPVAGKPMVRHAVETALASPARPVIVVTGHEAEAVEAALAGLDVRPVRNPDYASGQASSLRAGIAAVPDDCDGALVLLADMPFVTAATLGRLIAGFAPGEGRDVLVPVRDGRRGNPVLWGRGHFAALLGLTGDAGARHLLDADPGAVTEVAVADPGIHHDLDTPEAVAAAPISA